MTGTGRQSGQRGARILLDGHRPRWIISAGFGGVLDPLRRNERLVRQRGREPRTARFGDRPGRVRRRPSRSGSRPAGSLTVDEIVRTAAEKAELRQRVRGRRRRHGDLGRRRPLQRAAACRFLSIRVVSDEAGVDLPPEILAILGPIGRLSPRRGPGSHLATAFERQGPAGPPRARRRGRRPAARPSWSGHSPGCT